MDFAFGLIGSKTTSASAYHFFIGVSPPYEFRLSPLLDYRVKRLLRAVVVGWLGGLFPLSVQSKRRKHPPQASAGPTFSTASLLGSRHLETSKIGLSSLHQFEDSS